MDVVPYGGHNLRPFINAARQAYNAYRYSREFGARVARMARAARRTPRTPRTPRRTRTRGGGSAGRRSNPRPTPTNRGSATVTRQHDLRTQFKRRRVSKKYKQLKRFAKRVKKAEALHAPLHTTVEATSVPLVMSTAVLNTDNLQITSPVGTFTGGWDLRLMHARTDSGFLECADALRSRSFAGTPTGATANVFALPKLGEINQKFWAWQKMDLAIQNTSNQAILLDIYICRAAQNITDSKFNTAMKAWQQSCDETVGLNQGTAYTAKLGSFFAGTTPLDAPGFGSYWTVVSQQRMSLEVGEVVSTKIQPKGKLINQVKWDGIAVKKGVTHDVILVACPTYNLFGNEAEVCKIQWAKTTHVRYPDLLQATQQSFTGAKAWAAP